MTCPNDAIVIVRNNDSDFNGGKLATINLVTEILDLSNFTATLNMAGIIKTFDDLSSGSITVNLTATETKNLPPFFNGVLNLIDSTDKVATIESLIPFKVISTVHNNAIATEPYTLNFDVKQGGETILTVNVESAVSVEVGMVATLNPDEDAYVRNSGTDNHLVLDFGIPQGVQGEQGIQGIQGQKGDKGDKGDTGAGMIATVVSELPITGETGKLYLVPKDTPEQEDIYDEWIWAIISSNPETYGWEHIGSTEVDLTGVVKSVNNQTPDSNGNVTLSFPVTDVLLKDTSIVSSGGVATIPQATSSSLGAVRIGNGLAIQAGNGSVYVVAATESNLINKLNSSNPVVSTNLDMAIREGLGNNNLTWSDAYKTSACKTIGTVSGVQINGTDLTPDTTTNKVNIPKASNSTPGVVQTNGFYGIEISANGYIATIPAAEATLAAKLNGRNVVVANNLDIAVREGLGNNSLTWTDAYKANARNTIGAEAQSTIQALSATDSITLADNTIYNGGEITSLTITLPSTATLGFLCEIDFSSGTTASTLAYSLTDIKWLGDDLVWNDTAQKYVFLPVASKRYMVVISYDGVEYVAIVKGIE